LQYRTLGKTGIAVSTLALGTMGFGNETPEEDAHALLDAFLDAGAT
jgi:aryl-alcohol dehydrogenase-like predicted oxidoreductase